MESQLYLHTTCEKRPNVRITQCSLKRVMCGMCVCACSNLLTLGQNDRPAYTVYQQQTSVRSVKVCML